MNSVSELEYRAEVGGGIGVGMVSSLWSSQAERAARMTRRVVRKKSLREAGDFLTLGCLLGMDGKEATVGF